MTFLDSDKINVTRNEHNYNIVTSNPTYVSVLFAAIHRHRGPRVDENTRIRESFVRVSTPTDRHGDDNLALPFYERRVIDIQ